jgi:hypothetical protein
MTVKVGQADGFGAPSFHLRFHRLWKVFKLSRQRLYSVINLNLLSKE